MKNTQPIAIIEQNDIKRRTQLSDLTRKQKGQSLILVPEVAMLQPYRDAGVLYHAGLSQPEKRDIWNAVQAGTIPLVIGTQKALFLPFKNLSTIIIDEEQFESYKLWDQYPRLHSVRGARALTDIFAANMVYASSYPSIQLRYMIEQKLCEVASHHPVVLQTHVIPFAFEDRKWKRSLPNEAGTNIRAWARQGKKVLVLYNKKDNAKIREALHFRLSKKAKENVTLGTASLLKDAADFPYDHVVWIAPEFTAKAFDYRSSERARLLAARLQKLTPKKPITLVTRSEEHIRNILTVSDDAWYEHIMKERRSLNLPPFTDLVRLTVRDKKRQKAQSRAEAVFELLLEAFAKEKTVRAFGPFQERKPKKTKLVEFHILLSGELDRLIPVYENLPIDSADVDPHTIV